MLIYVDDIIVTGSSDKKVRELIQALQADFALKDLGELHFFPWHQSKQITNRSCTLSVKVCFRIAIKSWNARLQTSRLSNVNDRKIVKK